MTPYGGLGIWIWEADKNDPDSFCARLRAHGYGWVVVKAHDGMHPFNDSRRIEAWRNACIKHRLRFGVWGYVYDRDPQGQAQQAINLVNRYHAEFYVGDAEKEFERATGPVSHEFCESFRRGHPRLPAALSTFGRIDLHTGIDFAAWRDHGFDLMPQAYECDSSLLAPSLCINAALRIWSRNRIYPTLGTYQGARGVLSGKYLHDSTVDIALPGVNVWGSQDLHGDQLEQIGNLAHRPAPGPRPNPPNAVQHRWDKVLPHRDLRLTSPLTRGPDVQHLQQAINDRLDWRGGSPIVIDGEFGPITHHSTRVAAYTIGLVDYEATVGVQRLIEFPWLRNPVQRQREKERAAHFEPGGLAQLPKIAAKYIGVAENPPGSNRGHPYPSLWEEHFALDGVPWCGCFAGSVILAAGGHVGHRVTYCPYIEADARSKTNGFETWVDNHQDGVGPGWLVLYCWDRSGVPEHVGIVESIQSDHLVAIEGNTSGTNASDGGMVARMRRDYGPTVGYARPRL